MKKILAMILALVMCFGLMAGCSNGEGGKKNDEVYRLSVTFHDSAQALKTQYVQKWADAVNEASEGRLEVTVYAGGTLAGAAEALDAVKQGQADIGVCFSGFYPGQFDLCDVITMPLAGMDNSVQSTNVLWDLWESTPEMQAELDDYKVIMLYAGPNNIICSSKQVETLDDMAGLKLRASAGTATDMSTGWGATPMNIASNELYQSMEKNVIDGYIIDWTGVNAWSLFEVTDYYIELPFFTQTWAVLMNMDSYNKLPDDLKAIIDEYSTREWSLGFGELNEQEAGDARTKAVDEFGSTVTVPSDDQIATFKPAADAYIQQWIEKHTTDSFDAQAYFDKAVELGEKYK